MIAAEGKIILVPFILLALTTTGVSIYSEMGGSGLKGVNIALWIFILFSCARTFNMGFSNWYNRSGFSKMD